MELDRFAHGPMGGVQVFRQVAWPAHQTIPLKAMVQVTDLAGCLLAQPSHIVCPETTARAILHGFVEPVERTSGKLVRLAYAGSVVSSLHQLARQRRRKSKASWPAPLPSRP